MPERPRVGKDPVVCPECGTTAARRSNRQRFCSSKCRDKAWWRGRERNREAARETSRRWRANNRERHRAASRAWQMENPERYRANMRRAQTRRRLGKDDAAVAYAQILAGDPCSYCGGPAGEIDHIVPVAHGGTSAWVNLTAACKSCNSSKSDRKMVEFLCRAA